MTVSDPDNPLGGIMKQERTYINPGDCLKCGCPQSTIRWTEIGREFGGQRIGTLDATCKQCGYDWPVTAKDET